MSCQKSDPCICVEISGIATGQTFHRIYIWRKVVQKNHFWREINEFSPLFNHKWIKIMLIQGKSNFCSHYRELLFFQRAQKRILQSDWFSARSVFSYLCPTFVAIFINISRFSAWVVVLSKNVDHYLKPIIN